MSGPAGLLCLCRMGSGRNWELVATKGRERSIGFIIIKNRELKRNRKGRGEGRRGEEEKVMLMLWLYFLKTSRISGER
jgi:hypothetical protein